jgi:hypothetical protein
LTKTENIVLGKNPLNQPMITKRGLTEKHDLERSLEIPNMATIDRLRWIKPFPQVIEWPNLPGFFPRASKHGTSLLSPGKLPKMPTARSLERAIYGLKPVSVLKISTLFWKQEALPWETYYLNQEDQGEGGW